MGSRPEVPLLKPTDLFDKRRQRDTARLKAYNTILEQIYTRIRTVSRMGTSTWLTFTIPPFILGLPRIDLEDCVVYLVYMLRQQQYEVRYTYPNLLYISWKHHEKEYILKGSPIMQAMLPVAPSGVKKAAQGVLSASRNELQQSSAMPRQRVRFSDDNSSSGGVAMSNPLFDTVSMQPRAPPRNIHDYQPPASFLNALERPPAAPRRDVINDLAMF